MISTLNLMQLSAGRTHLDCTIHRNDIIPIENVDITSPDGVFPRLHSNISPVGDIRRELLQTTHGVPSVIDKDLVLGVGCIACVHDEPRQVSKTVNPERVSVEIALWCLELDACSRFVLFTVKNNLANGLEVVVIINQGSEEFVNHPSTKTVSVTIFGDIMQSVNAPLDKVGNSFPFRLRSSAVKESDSASCVVSRLLPLRSD